IAVHVRTLFEIDVPGQSLDVHHSGVGGLREVQDDERTRRASVSSRAVGHDLNGGLALLSGLSQMPQLSAHHADTSDRAMDDRLIDHGPQPRPVIASQDLLPGQTNFDTALDFIYVKLSRTVPERRAGVILSLE